MNRIQILLDSYYIWLCNYYYFTLFLLKVYNYLPVDIELKPSIDYDAKTYHKIEIHIHMYTHSVQIHCTKDWAENLAMKPVST